MSKQRGQAGFLLILIMAAVGVLSVGVASRGVDSLRTQDIDNDSTLAQQAAEAGLDVARKDRANANETLTGTNKSVSFAATYTSDNTPQSPFVDEGDVAQLLINGFSGPLTGVNVYWNETANTDAGKPALLITVVTGDPADPVTSNYGFKYYYLDADNTRTPTNKFTYDAEGAYSYQGVSYRNKYILSLAAITDPYLIRVTPLYKNSRIAFEATGGAGITLPPQRVKVTSIGSVDNNGKKVQRTVTYDQYSDRVPLVFQYLIYTNGTISQ